MMTCVAFAPHPHRLPAGRETETSTLVHVLSEPWSRGTKGSASKLATHLPACGETVRKRGRHTRTRRYEC